MSLVNRPTEKPCAACDEIHPHKWIGKLSQCQACGHASANLRAAHYTIDPNTADRAALDLALAYEPSAVAVSWESQMKAEAYVNTHELYDVLKEIERLWEAHDVSAP